MSSNWELATNHDSESKKEETKKKPNKPTTQQLKQTFSMLISAQFKEFYDKNWRKITKYNKKEIFAQFVQYLKENLKNNDTIKQLSDVLWNSWPLSYEHIKDLWFSYWTTIDNQLHKHFQSILWKDVENIIANKYVEKVRQIFEDQNQSLEIKNLKTNFEQYFQPWKQINNMWIFVNKMERFLAQICKPPMSLDEQNFQKLKDLLNLIIVSNDEIFVDMSSKWIINNEEFNKLKWDFQKINDKTNSEIKKLINWLLNLQLVWVWVSLSDEFTQLSDEISKLFCTNDLFWYIFQKFWFKTLNSKNLKTLKILFAEYKTNVVIPWIDLSNFSSLDDIKDKTIKNKVTLWLYIYYIWKQSNENSLKNSLIDLYKLNFDFSKLSLENKNVFIQKSIDIKLEDLNIQKTLQTLNIDKDEYRKHLKDFLTICADWKNKDWHKVVVWTKQKNLQDSWWVNTISDLDNLIFDFSLFIELKKDKDNKIDNTDENIINLKTLYPHLFIDFWWQIFHHNMQIKVQKLSWDWMWTNFEWFPWFEMVDQKKWKFWLVIYDLPPNNLNRKKKKDWTKDFHILQDNEKNWSYEIAKDDWLLIDDKNLNLKLFNDFYANKLVDKNYENIHNLMENSTQNKEEKEIKDVKTLEADYEPEFNRLDWDKETKLEQWTEIYMRIPQFWIYKWFASPRIKCVVLNVNKNTKKFKFKIFWVDKKLNWDAWYYDWNEIEWDLTQDGLAQLIRNANNNVYRFKNDTSPDFASYITSAKAKSKFKWFDDFIKYWGDISNKNWTIWKNTQDWFENIVYLWRKILNDKWKENYQFFQVVFKNWTIEIKDETWKLMNEMNFHSFSIFWSDNKMIPFTKKEYDIEKNIVKDPADQSNKMRMLSIWAMITWWKSIVSWFDSKLKQKQEFAWAKFANMITDSYAFSALWKIAWFATFWYMSWIFESMQSESSTVFDQNIWREISRHKDELDREWAAHVRSLVTKFERDIFWNNWIYKKNQLKAAWYFLYAIEKWWSMYFRELSKKSEKWLWVEAILWPQHKKKFLIQLEKKIQELKRNPWNDDKLDEVVKAELYYIASFAGSPEWQKIFWSKFSVVLEWWAFDWVYWKDKINEAYNWVSKKNTFNEMLDDVKWATLQLVPWKILWSIKALSERTEDDFQYYQWCWAMLMPLLSWVAYRFFDKSSREYYRKLARSYSFPLWFFLSDCYTWSYKLAKILDYVSTKIWLQWDDIFSKVTWWKKDYIEVWSMENIMKDEFITKFLNWWYTNWKMVMEYLNLENVRDIDQLINAKNDKSKWVDDDTKSALKEYTDEKIVNSSFDSWSVDKDLETESWLHYWKSALILPTAIIQNLMLNFNTSWFRNPKWKIVADSISKKLHSIDKSSMSKELFEFILKKYLSWFWPNYSSYDEMLHLISWFNLAFSKDYNQRKMIFEDTIVNHFILKIPAKLPSELKNVLDEFVEIFAKSYEVVNNVTKEPILKDEKTLWEQINSALLDDNKKHFKEWWFDELFDWNKFIQKKDWRNFRKKNRWWFYPQNERLEEEFEQNIGFGNDD